MLLVATLADQGLVPVLTAFGLVLGANLGRALVSMLSVWRSDVATRRLPALLGAGWINATFLPGAVLLAPHIRVEAVSLAGTHAFDKKDYAGAVKYWEKLVAAAPGNPDAPRDGTYRPY